MINSVLDAVTTQLGTTFGMNYRYYVEDVEQNLVVPCFTVDVLQPSERSKSPWLYDRTAPLVIHYFTDDKKDTKKDCYAMAERLVECLEYLPFKNTILRGESINWHIVDGVLQVFVTYKFITVKTLPVEPSMEDLVETNVSHT